MIGNMQGWESLHQTTECHIPEDSMSMQNTVFEFSKMSTCTNRPIRQKWLTRNDGAAVYIYIYIWPPPIRFSVLVAWCETPIGIYKERSWVIPNYRYKFLPLWIQFMTWIWKHRRYSHIGPKRCTNIKSDLISTCKMSLTYMPNHAILQYQSPCLVHKNI